MCLSLCCHTSLHCILAPLLCLAEYKPAAQASAKTKARLKDLEEEYSMFRQPVAAMAAPNMYRSLDPGLNLAADYYDSFSEGYGNLHDARKVGSVRLKHVETARMPLPCSRPAFRTWSIARS